MIANYSVTRIDLLNPAEVERAIGDANKETTIPEDCKRLVSLSHVPVAFVPAEHLEDTIRQTPIYANERIPENVIPKIELRDSRDSPAASAQRANVRSAQFIRAGDEEDFWKAGQNGKRLY